MNKERVVFIVAVLLLTASAKHYLCSAPDELSSAEPLARYDRPEAVPARAREAYALLELDRSRSPFMPCKEYAPPPAPQDPPVKILPGDPPQPPPQNADRPAGDPGLAFSPKLEELRLAYMGIARMGERAYGLLRRDGATPLRIKPGDVLEEYGVSVAAIEIQDIVLLDREGRRHYLHSR